MKETISELATQLHIIAIQYPKDATWLFFF
jgi:hypothetical protein